MKVDGGRPSFFLGQQQKGSDQANVLSSLFPLSVVHAENT